jgi:hypothetical protein
MRVHGVRIVQRTDAREDLVVDVALEEGPIRRRLVEDVVQFNPILMRLQFLPHHNVLFPPVSKEQDELDVLFVGGEFNQDLVDRSDAAPPGHEKYPLDRPLVLLAI